MSRWKYLTHIERIPIYLGHLCGDGTDWCMFAGDGDTSYSDHHAVLISSFSALLCTHGTPVRNNLGCWPPFTIIIDYISHKTFTRYDEAFTPHDEDSLIAALEHPDRIRKVGVSLTDSQLKKVVTVMQEPFLALTHLSIWSEDGSAPALPSGFLGGSAPCLQFIHLEGIPFPALPTLLSSTSDLASLYLDDIPQDGYISPETMAAGLSAFPRLERLLIGFQSVTSPRSNTPASRNTDCPSCSLRLRIPGC